MNNKLDGQNNRDKKVKQYNEIKKRYLYKIGLKLDYRQSKRYEELKSKPIPIPVPLSSDDDIEKFD